MPTREALTAQLKELEHEIVGFLSAGKVMPGFEQAHTEAVRQADELRALISSLSEPTSNPPEDEDFSDTEDPVYGECLQRAEAHRRAGRWEDAQRSLDDAMNFAVGVAQQQTLVSLRHKIEEECRQAQDKDNDDKTSALLAGARSLAEESRYPEALAKVAEALRIARDEIRPDVADIQKQMLSDQASLAQRLLQSLQDDLRHGKLEDAGTHLSALETVYPLLPGLSEQREAFRRTQQAQFMTRELAHVEDELKRLWSSGLLVHARTAKTLIESKTSEYPDNLTFADLKEKAVQREKDAAEREQIWVTSLMSEEFTRVVNELREKRDRGVAELPSYEIREQIKEGRLAPDVVVTGSLPTEVALNQLVEQISLFSRHKAEEYLRLAQGDIPVNPRHAQELLIAALKFDFLPGETHTAITSYLEGTVLPRVQTRDEVDAAANAAMTQGVQGDTLTAWRALQSIARLDPDSPIVAQKQAILRPDVQRKAVDGLQRCGEDLKIGKWSECAQTARNFRDLLSDDDHLSTLYKQANQLADTAIQLEQLQHTIDSLKDSMDVLLATDVQAARKKVDDFCRNAGELAKYFPEIDVWYDQLEARHDLRSVLADIEADYRSLSQAELIRRIERLSKIKPAEGKGSEFIRESLKETSDRLQLRLDFLKARDSYQAGGVLRQQAESVLLRVANAACEDSPDATQILANFESLRQNAKKAEADLALARKRVTRQSDYAGALTMLECWRDQPDQIGEQIRTQIRLWERKWQDRLVGQLNTIRDNQANVPLGQIEEKVGQLRKLAPQAGEEWERQFMPGIYQRTAAVAKRTGSAGLKRALELLDKALSLNGESESLQRERRAVDREMTLHNATRQKALTGAADAFTLWLKFTERYQDDAPAHLELAHLAYETGAFEQALRHLEIAQKHGAALGEDLLNAVSVERDRAQEAREVQQIQESVARALNPDNKPTDYRDALGKLSGIIQKYPGRQVELGEWRSQQIKRLTGELVARLTSAETDISSRWTTAVKIQTLTPDNPEARSELGRAVMAVERLAADAEALQNDVTGPTEHPTETTDEGRPKLLEPHEALGVQIRQAEDLQGQAYLLKSLLDEQSLNLGITPAQQSQTTKCVEQINRRLLQLKDLRRLVREGQARLKAAQGRCFRNWGRSEQEGDAFVAVRDVLGRIPDTDANHLTVEALRQDYNTAAQRREDISQKLSQLQLSVDQEDFSAVLNLIEQIVRLDDQCQFDVIRSVRIRDIASGDDQPLISGHDETSLKVRTEARIRQWDQIDAWQKPLGLVDWQDGQLPPGSCWLSWGQHVAALYEDRYKQGLFKQAGQIIRDVIGEADSSVEQLDKRWSLRHIERYLVEPRDSDNVLLTSLLDPTQLLSQKVAAVAAKRKRALALVHEDLRLLEGPRTDGNEPEMKRVEQDDANFRGYMEAIDEMLGRLQQKNWLGRGIPQQERAMLCDQLKELINGARAIAPDHPGWQNIMPQVHDQCSGG